MNWTASGLCARGLLALLGLLVAAFASAPAHAAGPGLPRTYQPRIIDTPNPMGSGSFGWGLDAADLTGDGKPDLLVPQSNGLPGEVYIWDGVTRKLLDVLAAPEPNVNGASTFAYVYVNTMPDIGSCPGGDGADADKICDAATIGPGDGIPEIIAGSRNQRVNNTNGALPPVATDPNVGRGYVFDGATRAVLKRIDMPPAERQTGTTPNLPSNTGFQSGAQFGRMMMNPSGLPPCAGPEAANGNLGVGPCPTTVSAADRIGDADGGGKPDIVITARGYNQPKATAFPGSLCAAGAGAVCNGAGKAWLYAGEDIAGTNPQTILETAVQELPNPRALPTGGSGNEYGGNVFRVGDITGDGFPEWVIPDRNADYPLNNPDPIGGEDVGASFTWSNKQLAPGGSPGGPCAKTVTYTCMIRTIPHPDPQLRAQFPNNFNSGRPTGDLGATSTPDFLQPDPLYDVKAPDDGRVYVFNGDFVTPSGGGEQSYLISRLEDPSGSHPGANFGGGTTGVGDLVSNFDNPRNEVMISGFHFDTFTDPSNEIPEDIHIMNPSKQRNLQTIPHPTQTAGDGFGMGLTPMGDLNGDGFLDFAASAYLANVGTTGAAGRAFIFYSDNSPLPRLPSKAGTTVTKPKVLVAGACSNDTLGTDKSETLNGTVAGDRIAGYGGDDLIRGFEEDDCLHGGSGADRMFGDADQDRLLGGSGNDRLAGGSDRDTLFGMSGADRLAGGFGRDRLYGGGGNDRLNGGGHGDRLFGERGDDRILAGGAGDGSNNVDAGPGNDVINVRNGKVDRVRCGAGVDRVKADRGDRLNGCERISRRRVRAR